VAAAQAFMLAMQEFYFEEALKVYSNRLRLIFVSTLLDSFKSGLRVRMCTVVPWTCCISLKARGRIVEAVVCAWVSLLRRGGPGHVTLMRCSK